MTTDRNPFAERPNRFPWPPVIYVIALVFGALLGKALPSPWFFGATSELLLGFGFIMILVALGIWQMQRLDWKQGVLANIETRIAGDPEPLPENTYDDGTATFLTWPSGKDVPAILVTNSEGTEGPVNFTVRGDTIVVDGVPRSIVLRSGEDSATLINTGPERPAVSASGSPALAAKGK